MNRRDFLKILGISAPIATVATRLGREYPIENEIGTGAVDYVAPEGSPVLQPSGEIVTATEDELHRFAAGNALAATGWVTLGRHSYATAGTHSGMPTGGWAGQTSYVFDWARDALAHGKLALKDQALAVSLLPLSHTMKSSDAAIREAIGGVQPMHSPSLAQLSAADWHCDSPDDCIGGVVIHDSKRPWALFEFPPIGTDQFDDSRQDLTISWPSGGFLRVTDDRIA